LDTLLNRYELRQVRERIALRARIAPLTKTESEDYIDHRLSLVRGEPRAVFSKQALDRIVKSANGIPRGLNILCDAVLIAGFEYRQAIISDRIAKEAIAVFIGLSQPPRRLQPRYAVGMLSVVLMVVFYLVYLSTMPGITVSGPSEDTVQRKEPPKPVLGTIGTDQLFARDRDPDSVPPARLVSELEPKEGNDLSPEERMELSETARLLAVLLDSGRVVLGRAQSTINNPRIGDKGFSSSVFEGQLRAEFQTRTRHDLHNLAVAPMPESAKHLLLRLAFFMQKAVHDVQPDINKKGIGFKGFIPATFGTQVAYSFSKDTGLKLRQIGPPGTEPRNPDNKPNEQEEQLLYAVQKSHPRVGDHIVEQQLADIRGVRVMLPLFYSKQCLACHGNPKGQVDISGYPKEGFKEGDLGGAISIVLSAQKKLTKSSE
jgi:general secretion pathway protein A